MSRHPLRPGLVALLLLTAPTVARAQGQEVVGLIPKAQKPIQQVLHGEAPGGTKPRPRLKQETPRGKREKLDLGTLFLPEGLKRERKVPLFVHFHGAPWLPEAAAALHGRAAVIAVQLGSGSAVYGKPFADRERFSRLLREAEAKAGVRFEPVGLTAWSAGYGAVRAILSVPEHYERVRFVVLLDGLHASYVKGKPGTPLPEQMEPFVRFARDAAAGKRQMIVTHSEIVPGTYASTTETADYLLSQLGLRRGPAPRQGPPGMRPLSGASRGQFVVVGYAGNTAADHVDHLHCLPDFLRWLE